VYWNVSSSDESSRHECIMQKRFVKKWDANFCSELRNLGGGEKE
jgi:hypothetical protein